MIYILYFDAFQSISRWVNVSCEGWGNHCGINVADQTGNECGTFGMPINSNPYYDLWNEERVGIVHYGNINDIMWEWPDISMYTRKTEYEFLCTGGGVSLKAALQMLRIDFSKERAWEGDWCQSSFVAPELECMSYIHFLGNTNVFAGLHAPYARIKSLVEHFKTVRDSLEETSGMGMLSILKFTDYTDVGEYIVNIPFLYFSHQKQLEYTNKHKTSEEGCKPLHTVYC